MDESESDHDVDGNEGRIEEAKRQKRTRASPSNKQPLTQRSSATSVVAGRSHPTIADVLANKPGKSNKVRSKGKNGKRLPWLDRQHRAIIRIVYQSDPEKYTHSKLASIMGVNSNQIFKAIHNNYTIPDEDDDYACLGADGEEWKKIFPPATNSEGDRSTHRVPVKSRRRKSQIGHVSYTKRNEIEPEAPASGSGVNSLTAAKIPASSVARNQQTRVIERFNPIRHIVRERPVLAVPPHELARSGASQIVPASQSISTYDTSHLNNVDDEVRSFLANIMHFDLTHHIPLLQAQGFTQMKYFRGMAGWNNPECVSIAVEKLFGGEGKMTGMELTFLSIAITKLVP
ncbi:hypothetical protein MIND_01260500 [Mycena indigotica]|uniref:Uncharacterized protein n=1 Tax=Mycena indigotica TaxID=2126181 RepID=A0A8H6S2D2_9AGAR|nr:uncharacterized protein MIND_01260500 [Mycena indigotica]KAF7291172.1 hypothetical protein MIND_01260500 [Mycena indigotica]